MRRSVAVTVVGMLVVLLGACGVPQDGDVQRLGGTAVPYGLLDPLPTDGPSPALSGAQVTTPRVFFVDNVGRLRPVRLPLRPTGLRPVISGLLRTLSQGPTELERAHGLGSALGPAASLQLADVQGDVAVIDVDLTEQDPSAGRLPLAIGQIVLTVTSVEGVDFVQFRANGGPVDVPLPGGARTSKPVGPANYQSLSAPAPSASEKAQPTSSPSVHLGRLPTPAP